MRVGTMVDVSIGALARTVDTITSGVRLSTDVDANPWVAKIPVVKFVTSSA